MLCPNIQKHIVFSIHFTLAFAFIEENCIFRNFLENFPIIFGLSRSLTHCLSIICVPSVTRYVYQYTQLQSDVSPTFLTKRHSVSRVWRKKKYRHAYWHRHRTTPCLVKQASAVYLCEIIIIKKIYTHTARYSSSAKFRRK